MTRFQQDLDDLDRMVDRGATKDAIRSQIRLIGREIAALEAEYASLAEDHAKLQASHAKLQASQSLSPAEAPLDSFAYLRSLYYKASDPIPFCPHCWETGNRKVHLSGPIPMMDNSIECWECQACDRDYRAKQGQNFVPKLSRELRRRH